MTVLSWTRQSRTARLLPTGLLCPAVCVSAIVVTALYFYYTTTSTATTTTSLAREHLSPPATNHYDKNDLTALPGNSQQRPVSDTRSAEGINRSSLWEGNPPTPTPCHRSLRFAPTPQPVTALASIQGSGNTWVRHLLQQLTGIYTGSVYSRRGDPELWAQGYYGEGVRNGSVVAVKTHQLPPESLHTFQRAIVLLRNPFDAMFADFNRRATNSHTGIAPARAFIEHWETFAKAYADGWSQFNVAWLNFQGPLLLVNFDDLAHSLHSEVQKMTDFLQLPGDQVRNSCALVDSRGGSKRAKEPAFDRKDVFSQGQIHQVNRNIEVVQEALKTNFPDISQAVSAWKWTKKDVPQFWVSFKTLIPRAKFGGLK